jgi:hypothetical protein
MDTSSRVNALTSKGRATLIMMISRCSTSKYLYRDMIEGCFDGIMRSPHYKGCEDEKDEIVDLTIIKLNELCKN